MKHTKNFKHRDNPKAKQRELDSSWEALLARHSKPLEKGAKARGEKITVRKEVKKPSEVVVTRPATPFERMKGVAALPTPKVYTGNKIVGIATMHKSNLVPIFNDQAAVEVAQMRRG